MKIIITHPNEKMAPNITLLPMNKVKTEIAVS